MASSAVAVPVPTRIDPLIPTPRRGSVGAGRNGFTLMPDEARRIDDRLNDLLVSFARVEGKLDALTAARDDHETRLRTLEAWRWVQLGASAVSGGAVAGIVKLLSGT